MKTFSDSLSDLLLQNQGNSPFPKFLNTSMSALIKIPNLLDGIPYRQDHLFLHRPIATIISQKILQR